LRRLGESPVALIQALEALERQAPDADTLRCL
jgi:hypothetical protein